MTNINYLQIVPLSWQERFDMYMKCSKEELASMLAERDKYTGPDTCAECQRKVNHSISYSSSSTLENYTSKTDDFIQ